MGIWLYSLALAHQKTNVAIPQTTLVLHHHHTEVTSTKDVLGVRRGPTPTRAMNARADTPRGADRARRAPRRASDAR